MFGELLKYYEEEIALLKKRISGMQQRRIRLASSDTCNSEDKQSKSLDEVRHLHLLPKFVVFSSPYYVIIMIRLANSPFQFTI